MSDDLVIVRKDPWATFAMDQSPKTRRAYAGDLDQFFRFMRIGPKDYKSIEGITPADIVDFMNSASIRDGDDLKNAATIARKLSAIRMMFRWYRACGVVDRNPAEIIRGPKVSTQSPRLALTKEEARALVDAAGSGPIRGQSDEMRRRCEEKNIRDRAIVMTLLRSAIRREELVKLRLGDLVTISGYSAMYVRGKGGKTRTIAVHDETAASIASYLDFCGRENDEKERCVFQPTVNNRSKETSKPLTPTMIYYLIVGATKRAGIEKKISPHSLRHTAITLALDAGGKLERVQQMAGHSDPRTTIRYFRTADDVRHSPVGLIDF